MSRARNAIKDREAALTRRNAELRETKTFLSGLRHAHHKLVGEHAKLLDERDALAKQHASCGRRRPELERNIFDIAADLKAKVIAADEIIDKLRESRRADLVRAVMAGYRSGRWPPVEPDEDGREWTRGSTPLDAFAERIVDELFGEVKP